VTGTAPPALEARGVTVSYTSRPVLWDVDATLPAGALSAVVGPNGSGKSTLLRACLGLVPLDSGHVRILGESGPAARRRVAYVPQREGVDWDFPITVREVVEMGRYRSAGWIRRITRADHAVVDGSLAAVGMTGFARRQIGELSGGQRQRVFVARALAQRCPVMVLDEPFAGIDARTESELLKLFRRLRDEGTSLIVVHHDIATVRRMFDWALVLNVRTIACGPPAQALSPETLRRAYGGAGVDDPPVEEAAWAG
jgi:manganese/zinc/iron transport system ATP- binding protein